MDKDLVIVEKHNYINLFLKGFFLNFINIGVLAFWLGMVVVASPNLGLDDARIFKYFTTIIIAYFLTDLIKILLAKQLKNKLTPIVIRKIKRGMGIALMIFGLVLAAKGLIPKNTMEKIDTVIEKNITKP